MSQPEIEFNGIQKTTLIDYPGTIACTLFTSGCNFYCGYCYNIDLVEGCDTGISISAAEALDFLKERKSFLDGICITGGEPLLHYLQILPFLKEAKALGYKVKLDTNGAFPLQLRNLLEENLLDYVAMDIKGPIERYEKITQRPVNTNDIQESIQLLQSAGIEYEFRTTVSSQLKIEDFDKIGKMIANSRNYYLQPAKLDVPLLDKRFSHKYSSPGTAELKQIADRMKRFCQKVEVRG